MSKTPATIPSSLLTAFVLFACLLLPRPAAPLGEDLEREFFAETAAMEQEYRDFERAAYKQFREEVEAMWNDFVTSTKKDWVEYSGDKTGRSRVDFENGEVLVEVLVPKKEADRDPRVVEKRLAREVTRLVEDRGKSRDYPLPAPPKPAAVAPVAEAPKEGPPLPLLPAPVLEGQLKDQEGKVVTRQNEKAFAREVVETRPVSKVVLETKKGEMVKAAVRFSLVPDHLRIRAKRYLDTVRRESNRFHIAVPLAFAVIHTESYFNPKATSPVPAYGLMQLVPVSGARDAYRYVYGEDRILPADYLYVPDNNIELGCAYIGLLENRYFGKVRDPRSRLYCAVAAYNTGAGNLSRTLAGTTRLQPAIDRANQMDAEELYVYLRSHLPHRETRDYLEKVRKRMDLYREWE